MNEYESGAHSHTYCARSCSLNCYFYQICSDNLGFWNMNRKRNDKKSSHQNGIIWPPNSRIPFFQHKFYVLCVRRRGINTTSITWTNDEKKIREYALTRKCRVSSWNWKMNEINSKIRQRVYGKSDTVPGCVCIQCMCAKTAVPTIPCYTLWMTKMGQKKDDRIKIDQKFKKRNKETREPACQPISQQKKLSKTDCYLSISPLSSPFKCLQIRLQTNID